MRPQLRLEVAAARVEGLQVPIEVRLDLETIRRFDARPGGLVELDLADRLLAAAIQATPLPGAGRNPCSDWRTRRRDSERPTRSGG